MVPENRADSHASSILRHMVPLKKYISSLLAFIQEVKNHRQDGKGNRLWLFNQEA